MDGISKLVRNSTVSYKLLSNEDSRSDMNDNRVSMKSLFTNASKLIFFGTRKIRIVVESLMASSFHHYYLKQVLFCEAEKYSGLNKPCKSKVKMGERKFTSLRKTFNVLASGADLPKHNYSFRIDSGKLSTAMIFLQESLCVKPGVARDISIAGHVFKSMPVYERGGKSIESLNETYNSLQEKEDRVGRDTFTDIVKLLTKRGETKAGLSTYYIQLRYNSQVFTNMLKRIKELPFTNPYAKTLVEEDIDNILHQWDSIQHFLMWEYSHRHLKIQDKDITHCCTYALGVACTHSHSNRSCRKCHDCIVFFDVEVTNFMSRIQGLEFSGERDELDEIKMELKSMVDAIPILSYGQKHYMAHILRASVQFDGIDKIKLTLKLGSRTILIILDHKQKVLPMKYREGQVEYFGKKGMSVLGVMIVVWTTKEDGTCGFEYHFFDIVMKGHAGQDNVQVAAALELIVELVHERFPETEDIVLQSDNASCFSSQELIPYVFQMNEELSSKSFPTISKWIFTEAQTGRGRLDTHFSYVNVWFKSFVEDGNDVILEEDIVSALMYRGGLAGTTAVLYNVGEIPSKCLERKFKSSLIGSRATHEIQWDTQYARIYESSNITIPEIIRKDRLKKFKRVNVKGIVERTFVYENLHCLYQRTRQMQLQNKMSRQGKEMRLKTHCMKVVLFARVMLQLLRIRFPSCLPLIWI